MDIEQALQWVLANYQEYNIASVNMSLSTGGNHVNPTNFGIIGDELQQLAAANVIPVSAAGNTGKFGVSYPAANPYSLAVSSIDDYTNRKISSFSQHHPDLTDVFADGQGIRAANQNGGTTVKSGTSMAAPVVSRAIAVAQQLAEQELGRRLTFDEIKTLLAQRDDLLAPTKYEDDYQGKVLNIDNLGNAILAMAPSKPPQPPFSGVIAQVGRISDLNHNNQTILLDHTFTDPVIFAHTLSFNNGDPSIPRITDIQGGEFSLKLQEPENLDGTHINESLSFLALEKGIWELSDGTIIEVGTTTTDATTKSGWESITFNHDFANTPIVLTQVQTYNDPSFVRTRQNNISKNGFEVALEEQELNLNNTRGSETIAWMAISSGTGEWDGNAFMAGNTGEQVTDNWHTIDFGNTFNNLPQLFGNIASYDGPDSAGLRYQNLSDDTVEIKIEEDTSLDDETVHTTENIGFLAIEGTGTLTGASFSPLTALIDNNIGTGDAEAFTLGDKSEAFYDNYGQQDYAEIFDFDTAQDVIQLHGIASDYSLRASPFSGNAQGIFLRVPGMEDELIGIVHNTSTLDLNSNNFVFV